MNAVLETLASLKTVLTTEDFGQNKEFDSKPKTAFWKTRQR
jgi:hypothetical protein